MLLGNPQILTWGMGEPPIQTAVAKVVAAEPVVLEEPVAVAPVG